MRGPSSLVIYLKGVAMGAADAVPGVSGGTIALIVGIYERLVTAIAAVDTDGLRALAQPWDRTARADARAFLDALDLPFLLPLGAGIVTAVILVTRGIDYLLETAHAATYAFFFGLIGAAAIVLYNQVSLDTLRHRATAMSGFLLAFVVAGLGQNALPSTLPVVFGAGLLAVSAMILPGVSGSLILLVLGQYEYMVDVLRRFVDGLLAIVGLGTDTGAVLEAAPTVATFIAGAVVGLLSIAKAIRWALSEYRAATLTFLVALMLGALRKPIDEIRSVDLPWSSTAIGVVLGAALAGAIIVFVLSAATDGPQY